jgi:Na+/H+ antiporter NhaC
MMLLTLGWAYASSITAVGTDRYLARIIMGDSIDSVSLPTLSFIASVLLEFAPGTSRETMAIMMPVVLVQAYEASGGNPDIFYGATGAIFSGASVAREIT